jgi:RNA ligase (TIGR02306 family)
MSGKPLCYISEIKNLEPIEGKDRIVLASFSNTEWRVIVGKDDFKIGDKAVYFETNSILPMRPEFEFLASRCFSNRYKGYRIRTMKMSEAYSEGIAFKLDTLNLSPSDYKVGDDLTKLFEVRAVEDEVPDIQINIKESWLQRKIKAFIWRYFHIKFTKQGFTVSDFPQGGIQKSDETQVQNLGYVFNELRDRFVYITTKIDGQSATYRLYKGIFTISSRNRTVYRAKIKKAIKDINFEKAQEALKFGGAHAYIAAKNSIPKFMKDFCKNSNVCQNLSIQGEIAGPGIQKNRLGLKDYELFVFSVFDEDEHKYFNWKNVDSITRSLLLKTVPFIERRRFNWESVQDIEKYTEQFSYPNGHPAEGVVIRADFNDRNYMPPALRGMNAMLSFKCINPKFKLKTQKED